MTSFHINCQYLDSEDNIQYSDNTFKKLYVGNEFLKDTYDSNKEEHLKGDFVKPFSKSPS